MFAWSGRTQLSSPAALLLCIPDALMLPGVLDEGTAGFGNVGVVESLVGLDRNLLLASLSI